MTPLRHQCNPKAKAKAKAKPKPRSRSPHNKKESVKNNIEEIIKASKLPPGQQALIPTHRLTTKVARPKQGRKKQG